MDAPDVGSRKPSSASSRGVAVAFAIPTFLVLAFVLFLHFTGARFRVSVSRQRAPSQSQCNSYFLRFHYGPDPIRMFCREGRDRAWYRAVIKNVGHRGAWPINCTLEAFDHAGRSLGREMIPVGMVAFPAGPFLGGGQGLTFDWYLKTVPAPSIERLDGRCDATDYGGRPPI